MLEGMEHPEFRPTSANPYYNIPTGLQSPYGDQLITMLESLVASNGKYNMALKQVHKYAYIPLLKVLMLQTQQGE